MTNWISLKEQLPPVNTPVLVCVKEIRFNHLPMPTHINVAFMYERMLSEYYETEESKKDVLRWSTLDTVTHWCELPEGPKE